MGSLEILALVPVPVDTQATFQKQGMLHLGTVFSVCLGHLYLDCAVMVPFSDKRPHPSFMKFTVDSLWHW